MRRFFPRGDNTILQVGQGNLGHSTHHRIDRLQIVSVGSLRDQSTTQFIVGGAQHKQAGIGFDRVRSP